MALADNFDFVRGGDNPLDTRRTAHRHPHAPSANHARAQPHNMTAANPIPDGGQTGEEFVPGISSFKPSRAAA